LKSQYVIKKILQILIVFTKFFTVYIVLSLSLHTEVYAQNDDIKFKRYSFEEGLSQSLIFDVFQDSKGFIWLGTGNGLCRFDGYEFKMYNYDPLDSTSISGNSILTIYEDKSGVLWIGTHGGGLCKYIREKENFEVFKNEIGNPKSLSDNIVRVIYEDNSGKLWIGTDDGLNIFNREAKTFDIFRYNPNDPNSISSNQIRDIYEDKSGILWIGTNGGGLNVFQKESKNFKKYLHESDNPKSISNDNVFCIYEDKSGTLWIGTNGGGLNKFDRKAETFISYKHNPENPHSLSHNFVSSILEDKKGRFWIATAGGGLNLFNRKKKEFKTYLHEPNNPNSISSNFIGSILEDNVGEIWFCTYGGGLNKISKEKKIFKSYRINQNNNIIYAIYEDKNNDLWIGTFGDGLYKYDRKYKKYKNYRYVPNDSKSLSNNIVSSITEDKDGYLWISTIGGGLNKFDKENGTFTVFKHNPNDPNSISSDFILCSYIDERNIIWLGTKGGGLNRFNIQTEKFTTYKYDPDDPNSLNDDYVLSIVKDREGYLWIGTQNGGLNRFDIKNENFRSYKNSEIARSLWENLILSIYEDKSSNIWIGGNGQGLIQLDKDRKNFTRYTQRDGLPSNVIYGILEDDKGNLWLSTLNGISKAKRVKGSNTKSEKSNFDLKFKNYFVGDGLQDNAFNLGAYFKNDEGEMFFGGMNGFNIFNPDSIKPHNLHVPPIVITDFKISLKSVPIGKIKNGHTILNKSITETDKIILSYEESYISFKFAVLDYVNPDRNEYAYMMEGLNEDWVNIGSKRTADFNLKPKDYVFRVKGSNNDGIWNEKGTSIEIIVTPPFWGTMWFKILIAIFLLVTVIGAHKVRTYSIKKKSRILEENNIILNEEISERRRVEKALKESEERYRTLVETMNEGLEILSEDGVIVYVNNRLCEMLEYSLDELIGASVFKFLKEDSKILIKEQIENTKAKNIQSIEVEWIKKDGDKIITIVSPAPIFNAKGEFIGSFAVITDITSRKVAEEEKTRLERRLFQSQKLESIGRLAGGIAHDFNNILTSMMGYAEILRLKYHDLNTTEGKAIDVIFRNTERAADLTKQLLGFARGGKYQPKPDNINKLIKEAIKISEKIFEKNIELKLNLQEDIHNVEVDKTQIIQVLTNLMINAKDAMPYGGTISFKTKNVFIDENYIANHPEFKHGDYVKITVSDTGMGMTKEIQDHIFEPFYTTKGEGEGTGLGLSMVYGIIKNHKGYINVYSEPGIGTEFVIYLPATRKKIVSDEISGELTTGEETILIVDDENDVIDTASVMLRTLGYKVITACNGLEAINVYKKYKDRIDLVLLDIIMPKMAGKETYLELKKINPNVIVILSSGYSQDNRAIEILKEGALKFIQKPFKFNELSKIVNETLKSKPKNNKP